jgi:hypothetical protein
MLFTSLYKRFPPRNLYQLRVSQTFLDKEHFCGEALLAYDKSYRTSRFEALVVYSTPYVELVSSRRGQALVTRGSLRCSHICTLYGNESINIKVVVRKRGKRSKTFVHSVVCMHNHTAQLSSWELYSRNLAAVRYRIPN